jgi:hypothetical protein
MKKKIIKKPYWLAKEKLLPCQQLLKIFSRPAENQINENRE